MPYIGLYMAIFQIWRPITALFYYPIGPATGFHFLINCYFLYNYSQRLEMGMFAGKPADYFYMLLFNWLCCVIIGLLVNLPVRIINIQSYLLSSVFIVISFWTILLLILTIIIQSIKNKYTIEIIHNSTIMNNSVCNVQN